MFQPWRQQLRDAQAALQGGRLDEAGRLLSQDDLRLYAPAVALSAQLAEQIVRRAEAEITAGNAEAAWNDLKIAAAWGADAGKLAELKARLVEARLHEAEVLLCTSCFDLAAVRLAEIRDRAVGNLRWQTLHRTAVHVLTARQFEAAGNFAQAKLEWDAAVGIAPQIPIIATRRDDMQALWQNVRDLTARLHQALTREDWPETLSLADRLLEIAPANTLARDARRRAWAAVGMKTNSQRVPAIVSEKAVPHTATPAYPQVLKMSADVGSTALPQSSNSPRFILWVDGVGGYLVCLADRVAIGPPTPNAGGDNIAILADLSRQHATLHRDGEAYVLQPGQRVSINGQPLTEPRHLAKDQTITLGDSVKLHFRQPHPLSATACLDMVSRHRMQPAADGIVLMADSLILGPKASSHIVCRDWPAELVIFRAGEKLFCRLPGSFDVDGMPAKDQAEMTNSSTICYGEFSVTLEPV